MATLKSASLDRKLSRSMTSVYFCKKTKAKLATFYKKESTAFLIYLREVISKFACIPIVTSQWGKESFAVSFTVSLMPYIIEKKNLWLTGAGFQQNFSLFCFGFSCDHYRDNTKLKLRQDMRTNTVQHAFPTRD